MDDLERIHPPLAQKRKELNALNAQIAEHRDDAKRIDLERQSLAANIKEIEISAALAGRPLPNITSADEMLQKLRREIDVKTRATETLRSQIIGEESAASAKLCESIRPQHDEAVRDMVIATLALVAAAKVYHDLLDAVGSKGSTGSLPQLNLHGVPHYKDHSSPLAYFLRSVRDAGLITNKQIPEQLR